MSPGTRAYGFALLTVLSWSTVAAAFKLSLRHLDIFQLVFLACTTSALILLCAVIFKGDAKHLIPTIRRHWPISIMSALLNPCAYYLVLFAAYDRLPAQVAQPINYTWAIVLTFFSIVILKQRMTWKDLVAAFICYAGVVVIVSQGRWFTAEIAEPVGVALALGSTLIWAGYWVINIRDEREPTMALCVNFLIAVPLTGLLCFAFSGLTTVSIEGLLGAIWVGLFEMGLAYLFWSHALKLADNTSRVSNLVFLSPFLSLVFIHILLDEPIFTTTYVGLAVIVTGLMLQQWRARAVD